MNFKISIICSVRNCLPETAAFLVSLKKHPPQFLDRVIILDDGSDQETKEFLSKNAGFYELYRNEKSKGFAFSNNFGASKVDSEWILFMNNDLVLSKEWSKPLESIIKGTDELKKLGCLGNVQTEPVSNKIDHAGVVFKSGIPEHFLKGENSKPEEEYSEFLAVTGACFMIRRELFLSMGGFDETYRTGFEDIDLCLRLGMLGYRHYVANRSEVVHKRSSTPERNQFQKHNSKIFYTRWGKLITRFQEWESVRGNDISTKTDRKRKSNREFDYVLKRRENFLFADRKVLDEYFQVFLKSENLEALQKVFSILEDNFVYDEDLFLKKAQLFQVLGEAKNAKKMLESLLKKNPRHLPAILNLGQLLIKEKARPQALEVLRTASVIFPGETKILFLMCRCKWLQGRIKEAKNLAQTCVLLDPNSFGGWSMLARIARKEGAFMEEVRILKVLLKLKPNDPSTVASLLQAYSNLHLYREIWQLCRQQTQSIQSLESLLIVAHASYLMGDFKLCKFFLQRMGKLGYENEEVFLLEGNLMVALKQFARAVSFYTRALEFAPNSFEILSNLANAKSFLCDWKTRHEEVEELQTISEQAKGKIGAFEILGLELNEKQECELASLKTEDILTSTEKLRLRLSFSYGNEQGAKKRIGFLSSDFRNHAVGHQMIALLENLDAEKYEIFLYASNPSVDSEIRKRFVALNENFRDVSNLSLAAKARCINHDKLDLLVDLGGFSRGHNADVLALRPSARQAHYLGYASSMGKGLVDYMIADRFVIPPKSSKDYGEKIIRMDGCFFPPGDFEGFAKRSKRKDVGLPSRGFVYCAFHAAYKLEPDIWASWMRILRAVPESVLWLKFKPSEETLKNLRTEAVRKGVSSKRIIMAEDMPVRSSHLSRMTVADLYLDCPKYNGHASAMDALHAKLPILTIKGNRFCNRVGESFCRNLGIGELVANDLKHYEQKAIELGLRPSLLLPLRKKIQENVDSVLSPVAHAQRFQQAIDQLLSKRVIVPKKKRPQDKGSQVSVNVLPKLEDFTLVMIRPLEITNWASNVNFLAEELAKLGGRTIVIEPDHPDHKKGDFSKHVKRLPQFGVGFAEAMNYVLTNVSTKFVFFLDDPLRALPGNHFIEVINQARETLIKGKIGVLGIGSSMEPNTGVLVTKGGDAATKKVAGLFAPSFAFNLEGMRLTGGFRTFGTTAVLSCLDLSLRLEEQGWKSVLIETEKLLCPASSAKDYLQAAGKQAIAYFGRIWKRKPVSLNPKFPPKEEQVGETADYQEWIRLCDTITEGDILSFRKEADELQVKPLISVVMPVFDPPKKFLIKAIESVLSQAYENWELCIADDASTKKFVRPLLESYARKDSRIKVTFRKTNGHISVASNSALKLAIGEFVAFLDHDDELRPHSLLEVAKVINRNPNAQLIYSDEDKMDERGMRYDPYFKPDWNPDLLLGQNYISHLSTFKTSLVKELKGLRKGFEGAQDWDLILRITEKLSKESIIHIPKILYHWRAIKGSTATGVMQKKNIFEATALTINQALERRGLNASLSFPDTRYNHPKIGFKIDKRQNPKVSILIPTKDRVDLLKKCISSILENISYNNYEVIIIDNESGESQSISFFSSIKKDRRVSVSRVEGDFNYSRLNNIAASKANGEILLLLNNDIESIKVGWFEEMLTHALRPEIGCVGAKLLYPDGRLQHGGVIVGLGAGAGHSHKYAQGGSRGYAGQLSVARNSTAVTAACMMVRKQVFMAAGGLDESNLKVAFNDVDFCLRVEKIGYLNFWTPFAELYHHESASRGSDEATTQKKERSSREILGLRNRWNLRSFSDNNYNSNLTNWSEQYWFGISKKSSSYPADLGDLKMVEEIDDSGNSKTKIPEGSPQKGNAYSSSGKKLVKQGHLKLEPGLRCNKEKKIPLIFPLLKKQFQGRRREYFYDCMPPNADNLYGVVETENISEHEYDGHAMNIINTVGGNGMILDCGSGQRPTYYSNVVNFDPVAYGTTDVVGVGEELPFKDHSFEAVFSLNVLEHVRDPFRCAREIARVLKPEGSLYCVVPFMSPFHGYPNHYYNMTKSGLRNLFENYFDIQKQDVMDSGHPIHSITWTLRSWAEDLNPNSKREFLAKKVGDLIGDPALYFREPFVSELSKNKMFELGATTALWGNKKHLNLGHEYSHGESEEKPDLRRLNYKESWNRLSSDFDSARLHVTGNADEEALKKSSKDSISRIDKYVKFKKDDIVLEIGCGIGRVGKELAPICKKWIGCDISDNMLLHAKRRLSRLKNIQLVELPECNLSPINASSVDVVYCTVVFMHLDEWDRYEYIKEAFRVLREGGRAYFDNFSLTTKKGWGIFEEHYKMPERPSHISKSSTPEELSQYMEQANFAEVKTELDDPWIIVSGKKSIKNPKIATNLSLKAQNGLPIFSLHIPKTGGTSFGVSLKKIYGSSFMFHYPELENQGTESIEIFEGKRCVHGHLVLDRYQKLCQGADLVTWLRNPVDRTLSLYHHILSNPDSSNEFHQRVYRDKPSILEFCEMPENHNQLFHWIGDRNPEDFKFIGFLEMAQASIVKCTSTLGWSHVPKLPWSNKTPKRNQFQVSASEREFIKSKNQDEMVWIEKAKEIFG